MVVTSLLLFLTSFGASSAERQPRADRLREFSCGPAALCVSAEILNVDIANDVLLREFGAPPQGVCSLRQIQRAAMRIGLFAQPVACDPQDPRIGGYPMIVALRYMNSPPDQLHFVVLYGMAQGKIQVIDYPRRPRFVSVEKLSQSWDGRGLYISHNRGELDGLPGVPARRGRVLRFAGWIVLVSCLVSLVVIRWKARAS